MDHVVYVDTKSKELEKLLDGSKSMIIRGATGIKQINSFEIDKGNYGNMDDWLPVTDINSVRK